MRSRNKEVLEEWANLDERVRVGATLLAVVRFTHELEAEAAGLGLTEPIPFLAGSGAPKV